MQNKQKATDRNNSQIRVVKKAKIALNQQDLFNNSNNNSVQSVNNIKNVHIQKNQNDGLLYNQVNQINQHIQQTEKQKSFNSQNNEAHYFPYQKISNNNINIIQENVINVQNLYNGVTTQKMRCNQQNRSSIGTSPDERQKQPFTSFRQNKNSNEKPTNNQVNTSKSNIMDKAKNSGYSSPYILDKDLSNKAKNSTIQTTIQDDYCSNYSTNKLFMKLQNKKDLERQSQISEVSKSVMANNIVKKSQLSKSPIKGQKQKYQYANLSSNVSPYNSNISLNSSVLKFKSTVNQHNPNNITIETRKEKVIKQSNIKTFVRFRPLNDRESPNNTDLFKQLNQQQIQYQNQVFNADSFFNKEQGQQDVYDQICRDSIKDALDGYNSCLFAYGPTGSGKTYSMYGSIINKGIIYKLSQELFENIQGNKNQIKVKASMLEIYNENLFDLLDKQINQKLKIKESQSEVYVQNLKQIEVKNVQEIDQLIQIGNSLKATRATQLNENSSRSHIVFQLEVQINLPNNIIKKSKINLIDLAGSENLKQSQVVGEGMKETKNINYSLSCLGNVISSLLQNNEHIPFRDSKLTRILQDSLNGNFKTSILVTCSPSSNCIQQTLNSLKFAHRVQALKTSYKMNIIHKRDSFDDPFFNMQDTIKQLQVNNKELKQQNQNQQQLLFDIKSELLKTNRTNFPQVKNSILLRIQNIINDQNVFINQDNNQAKTIYQQQQNQNQKPEEDEKHKELIKNFKMQSETLKKLHFELEICNKQIESLQNKLRLSVNESQQVKQDFQKQISLSIEQMIRQKLQFDLPFMQKHIQELDNFQNKSNIELDLNVDNLPQQTQIILLKQKIIVAYLINQKINSKNNPNEEQKNDFEFIQQIKNVQNLDQKYRTQLDILIQDPLQQILL